MFAESVLKEKRIAKNLSQSFPSASVLDYKNEITPGENPTTTSHHLAQLSAGVQTLVSTYLKTRSKVGSATNSNTISHHLAYLSIT